jgi:hypothetical protein
VNTGSPAPYRPSTLAEHPELTPEEIGRRLLRLIDSLKSFDELSDDRVRQMMRLPFVDATDEHGGFFAITLPTPNWLYGFIYSVNPKYRELTSAKLYFSSENERINSSLTEDMESVCGLDFNDYETALNGMGFKREHASYDELGRLGALQYVRGGVRVQIIPRREANTPDTKLNHACVRSISIHPLDT